MLSFEKPIFELKRQLDELLSDPLSERTWGSIRKLQSELRQLTEEIFSNLTAWELVQLARHEHRPHSSDYIIGEGGSDGALAIGMADHLAIFEYAYFSVLAPEDWAERIATIASQPRI